MIEGFGVKIWGYIVAAGGLVLAFFMFRGKYKNEGRKEVKDAVNAKTTETVVKTVRKVKEIDKKIESTPIDDLRDKLRQDWSNNSDSK